MPKIDPINVVMCIEPVAKARARVTFQDGQVRSYTPDKTKTAELEIKLTIQQHLIHTLNFNGGSTYFPAEMPLKLEATFVVVRPPSAPKKRIFPSTRPDCDNFCKTLLDACNRFLWVDDAQVTTMTIKKRYGLMPAIFLHVETDTGLDGARHLTEAAKPAGGQPGRSVGHCGGLPGF